MLDSSFADMMGAFMDWTEAFLCVCSGLTRSVTGAVP